MCQSQALHPVGESEHACSSAEGECVYEQSNQFLQTALQLTEMCRHASTFIYQRQLQRRWLQSTTGNKSRELSSGSLPLRSSHTMSYSSEKSCIYHHFLRKK